jgi:hypothetical protein
VGRCDFLRAAILCLPSPRHTSASRRLAQLSVVSIVRPEAKCSDRFLSERLPLHYQRPVHQLGSQANSCYSRRSVLASVHCRIEKVLTVRPFPNDKRPALGLAAPVRHDGLSRPPKRVLPPVVVAAQYCYLARSVPSGFQCIGTPQVAAAPIRTFFPHSLEQVACQTLKLRECWAFAGLMCAVNNNLPDLG